MMRMNNTTRTKTKMTTIMMNQIRKKGQRMLLLLFLLLFGTSFVSVVHGKVTTGNVKLSGVRTEKIMTSFAISPYGGSIQLVLELPSTSKDDSQPSLPYPHNGEHLRFYMVRDTEFSKYEKARTCIDKMKYMAPQVPISLPSSGSTSVGGWFFENFTYDVKKHIYTSRLMIPIESLIVLEQDNDNTNNEKKNNKKDEIQPRTYYYYFIIADCSLEISYQDPYIPIIQYELKIHNTMIHNSKKSISDYQNRYQTHFSMDQYHFMEYHAINFLITLLYFIICTYHILSKIIRNMYRSYKNKKNKNQQVSSMEPKYYSIHVAVIWITMICFFDLMSHIFEIIHLEMYEYNGIGMYTADALDAYCEAICDTLITLFLLSLGSGWTIPSSVLSIPSGIDLLSSSSPSNSNNKKNQQVTTPFLQRLISSFSQPLSITGTFMIHQSSISCMIGWCIFIVHIGLAQWGRMYDDEIGSYHDYEQLPGKILMVVRIIIGFLFWMITYQTSQRCSIQSLKQFYIHLLQIGMIWYFLIPFLVLIVSSYTIPYRYRLPTIYLVGVGIQTISLGLLTWFVTKSTSTTTMSGGSLNHYNKPGSEKGSYHQYSTITGQSPTGLIDTLPTSPTTTTNDSTTTTIRSRKNILSFGNTKLRLD